jgi:hypothetical protein
MVESHIIERTNTKWGETRDETSYDQPYHGAGENVEDTQATPGLVTVAKKPEVPVQRDQHTTFKKYVCFLLRREVVPKPAAVKSAEPVVNA